MNPYMIAMMLGQSGLLTQAIRTPWREAALSYLSKPHKRMDPFVLPALNALTKFDRTVMGPMDSAQRYASKYLKYLDPPPRPRGGASDSF